VGCDWKKKKEDENTGYKERFFNVGRGRSRFEYRNNENLELGSHSETCFSLTCGSTTIKHGSCIFKLVFYSLANIY